VYAGQIWLMSRGSYSVYVTVNGARGSGTAIVPITSFATGRLGLSKGLATILIALGGVLFAGMITIVRAATGEALLEPGERATETTKRRARMATLVATPLLALLVFGGARWWTAVDDDYERTMYHPPAVDVDTEVADGKAYLALRIHDTASFHAIFAPVIPDHGKMMHLFVVPAGTHDALYHLHPVEADSLLFRTPVRRWAKGRYRLYADILLATGQTQTVTTVFDWSGSAGPAPDAPIDDDDASWPLCCNVVGSTTTPVELGSGLKMAWAGRDQPLTAGTPVDLRFDVTNMENAVARLAPYLGMQAHAAVISADESVFIHLHPMGTVSTTAQQTFAARDRGDTTSTGRPTLGAANMTMSMAMDGHLSFPYEFPKPGRYRVWVQVRPDPVSPVLTGAFDLDVR
jgi:hypothetical protein